MIRQFPIPWPSTAEQQKIVEILEEQLSRLDAALEAVATVRVKADQFRRSLLHAAFTGALTGHDTSSGDLPAGWEERALTSVADVRLGRQRSPANHFGPNMRPYLRAANVTWKGLELDDVKEMQFTCDEMKTFELRAGDLLVNEASGSAHEVGKVAVVPEGLIGHAFQNTLLRVRAVALSSNYLYWLLLKNAVTGAYLVDARGVGIFHLGRARLARWPVPVPPADEQQQIVEILEAQLSRLDASLAIADAVERRAAALRRTLLHAAFSGNLTREWRETADV